MRNTWTCRREGQVSFGAARVFRAPAGILGVEDSRRPMRWPHSNGTCACALQQRSTLDTAYTNAFAGAVVPARGSPYLDVARCNGTGTAVT
jgi:hypothetical protein